MSSELLRQVTRVAHDRLDAHPLLARIVGGTIELSELAWLLGRFHAVVGALESRLAVVTDLLAPYGVGAGTSHKSALLALDLATLGVAADDVAPATAPVLESVGDAFGALYVLEGSGLGGMVLARHLRARFPLGPGSRLRYFGHGGTGTMAAWSEFKRKLDAFAAASPGEVGRMERAALATFAAFESALSLQPLTSESPA